MRSQSVIQPKEKRIRNFHEVCLGYPKRLAIEEARRYPQSRETIDGNVCPLGIDIPGFMRRLREGDAEGALAIIREKNPMPGVCGRICPAPCETSRGLISQKSVNIRSLERFAADNARGKFPKKISAVASKVAVVGSGPAGLAASCELALAGYKVTIFETLDKAGGVLRYGVPEFRLPSKVLDEEIRNIMRLGVDLRFNCFVGQTIRLEDLWRDGFQAILLSTGSGVPRLLDIPGANLSGVYYGEEFLMRIDTMRLKSFSKPVLAGGPASSLPAGRQAAGGSESHCPIGPRVLVIGSGNTALDSARCARRLGCQVKLAFVRSESVMRVDPQELEFAKEEGIALIPFAKPVELTGHDSGDVKAVKILKVKEDAAAPGSNEELVVEADTVVIAVGHHPNVWLKKFIPDLELNDDRSLKIDSQTGMTSVKGVFAAGNVVLNGGAVVYAMAAGQRAAGKIIGYLNM